MDASRGRRPGSPGGRQKAGGGRSTAGRGEGTSGTGKGMRDLWAPLELSAMGVAHMCKGKEEGSLPVHDAETTPHGFPSTATHVLAFGGILARG